MVLRDYLLGEVIMLDVKLDEVLISVLQNSNRTMFTAIPAKVVSVKSLAECRVDVQPSVNLFDEDLDVSKKLPPVFNVPVHMPTGRLGGLTFPVSVGDDVLLIFSQVGIDNWKRSAGDVPSNLRRFDIQDAVAVTGVTPFSESNNNPKVRRLNHSPEELSISFNVGSGSECEIRMKRDGNIVINTPKDLTINCQSTVVNAKDSVIVNTQDSVMAYAKGDVDVIAQGNASVKARGWGQVVTDDSLLIKSKKRLKLQGGGRSIVL